MTSTEQTRLGERLKVSRSAAGFTQEQAAEQVKLARTTLVAIERGDREVRPDELVAFANIYNVSVHSLLRASAIKVELVGQFRRTISDKTDDANIAAVSMLHDLSAAYVELERCLGKVSVLDYPPERKIGRGKIATQAEELAVELRTRLGLGLGPIPDLESILELELGLRIFVRPIASEISGVYGYHPEIGACVLLNSNHPATRRRWTLAHELAHFMTSRLAPSVMHDGPHHKNADDLFADAFAAAFLMPNATVRRLFDEYVGREGNFAARHLVLGARRLNVSLEAFSRQLEILELLPLGTYDKLRQQGLSDRAVPGFEDETPKRDGTRMLISGASGVRLMMLAAEAHDQGLYSEGQLADMLSLDRLAVREVIDSFAALEPLTVAVESRRK